MNMSARRTQPTIGVLNADSTFSTAQGCSERRVNLAPPSITEPPPYDDIGADVFGW